MAQRVEDWVTEAARRNLSSISRSHNKTWQELLKLAERTLIADPAAQAESKGQTQGSSGSQPQSAFIFML
jgi:hypothetical protein